MLSCSLFIMSAEPKDESVDDAILSPKTLCKGNDELVTDDEKEKNNSTAEVDPTDAKDSVAASEAAIADGNGNRLTTKDEVSLPVEKNELNEKVEVAPVAEDEDDEDEEDYEDEEDLLESDAVAESNNSELRNSSSLLEQEDTSDVSLNVRVDSQSGENSGEADGAATNRQQSPNEDMSVYHIKWINFQNKQVPIVTQNENGPCPLIAIANVLLLRQTIKLPAQTELVTSQQIVEYFGDYLLSADTKNFSTEQMVNFQQNMNDAFTLFPKLQTGLDMNLRFSGVRDFEYTPELGIFDLFEIPIYHGWLADPQENDLAETVRNCSYNQLVEKIINDKMDQSQEVVRKALLSEQFLEQTASQLTYYGLCELNSAIKEDQLAVFFRNNHFNTIYMHKSTLYLLVTDQGFLQESKVVWETLNDVEGNSYFIDSSFQVYQKPEVSTELPAVNPSFVNTPEQVNSDYQLALSLANDHNGEEAPGNAAGTAPNPSAAGIGRALTLEESDYALARRLQEEEDKMAAQLAERDGGSQSQSQAATHHHLHQQQQQQAAAASGHDPAASVHRTVPRSASQPSHAGSMHGQNAQQRPRPVAHTRRRDSGDNCFIL